MLFVYCLFIFTSVLMMLFGGLLAFSKPRDKILRPQDRFMMGTSMIFVGLFFDSFIFLAGQPWTAIGLVLFCAVAVLIDRKFRMQEDTEGR